MKNYRFRRLPIYLLPLVLAMLSFSITMEAQVVIQRCDVTTGWQGAETLSIDQTDKKEGSGSLMTQAQAGNTPWFYKTFAQTQTGIGSTGYLSFWLYVSDASKMEGGQIEISSSGKPDVEEYNWVLDKNNVDDGWNHIQLQISSADQTGGAANLNKINFFRIYQDLSGPVTVKLDFIRFDPSDGPPVWPTLDVPKVDNTTLDGKVMFGYQGWFNHPDDQAGLGWIHWGNFYEPINSTVDMYPDMREYGLDEKYDSDLSFSNGRMAPLFSSHNRNTVVRHMKWIRDYNLDGVFLQRFISESGSEAKMNHKDTVTTHIIEGCEKYGRVFAIMYDGIANRVEEIKADWMHLVDEIGVTQSDRYLNHRERPLVALWGYTVRDEATVDQLVALIDWFKNNPDPKYRASLLLGVAWDWYDESADWLNAFRQVEVISPWFSGNTDYDRGQAWCDQNNVEFLPVVHPGFSWYNLKGGPKNATPRNGGNFFWKEVNEVVSKNAKSVYIAMFDEVDEGTAMFKLAENKEMTPQEGYWLPLDADGIEVPGDWYLRAASLATQVVRGYEDNHAGLITPPEGIMAIRITDEVNDNDQGAMEFIFPDFPNASTIEISLDGGKNFSYSTPDNVGSYLVSGLSENRYHVWVRYGGSSSATDMGAVFIGNAIELPPTRASEPFPANNEQGVRLDVTLGWTAGQYVQSHIIYLDTTDSPNPVRTQARETYTPGNLKPNTTYYWRIDEVNAFDTTEGPLWNFTTAASGVSTDTLILDYCDSEAGWNSHNSLALDTDTKKEGFASLKSEGSGTVWFRKTFDPAVNTYCDTSSYLDLWVYVSDVDKFDGGGQIEITSSGGPDVDEYSWPINTLGLSNGWNELHLKIGDADLLGRPDLQAINFFRLYQFVNASIVLRVDNIRFTGLRTTPLSIPQNFSATAGDSLAILDWDDNPEPSLAGYNLYRTTIPGVAYRLLNTTPITTSNYRDEGLTNGYYYYYVLSAVDTLGFESAFTDEIAVMPQLVTAVNQINDQPLIKIFPNPAGKEQIRIELLGMTGKVQLSIRSINGKLIEQHTIQAANTVEIPIGSIPAGVYILSVMAQKRPLSSTLIVR